MNYFLKHEVKENKGKFELLLFLDKRKVKGETEEDFHENIKQAAKVYVLDKLESIPIKVVRIMIGSIPYFSFTV